MKTWILVLLTLSCGLFAADTQTAATAVNRLGVDIYKRLAKEDGNLCISPYSVQSALVMIYAGSDGITQEEMQKALHYPEDENQLHESFEALRLELKIDKAPPPKKDSEPSLDENFEAPAESVLNIANRLFGQTGYPYHGSFLAILKERHDAILEPVDFKKNPKRARERINEWVENETQNRIRDLIPENGMSRNTNLVLINAIYFRADWTSQFSESNTADVPFHFLDKSSHKVPTMWQKDYFNYAEEDGFCVVGLRCRDDRTQALLIIPEALDGLSNLEEKITAEDLAKYTRLRNREIVLHVPKFKLETATIALKPILESFGMKTAFDQGSADLSRILSSKSQIPLMLAEVFHKTFLVFEERGIEASGAMSGSGAYASSGKRAEPPVIRADRPFMFAIQHIPSGACLFLGRVTDPR